MLARAASGRDLCSSTKTWYTMAHASVQNTSRTLTARYSPKYSGVSSMTSMMYSGTVICRTRSEATKKFVNGMMTAVNTSSGRFWGRSTGRLSSTERRSSASSPILWPRWAQSTQRRMPVISSSAQNAYPTAMTSSASQMSGLRRMRPRLSLMM